MNDLLHVMMLGLAGGVLGIAVSHLFKPARRLVATGLVLVAIWLVGGLAVAGTAVSVTAIGAVISVSVTASFWQLTYRSLVKSLTMAPAIQAFVRDNWDRLDLRGTGLITRSDLELALSSGTLGDDERRLVKRLMFDLLYAGHIVDSIFTMSPMSGAGTYVHTYGVSREDLDGYPARVRQEFERMFGNA